MRGREAPAYRDSTARAVLHPVRLRLAFQRERGGFGEAQANQAHAQNHTDEG